MLDENGAIWIPNNNYFPGRSGRKPRWIIIHGTAGFTSAEEVAHFFKSTEGGDNPVLFDFILLFSNLLRSLFKAYFYQG